MLNLAFAASNGGRLQYFWSEFQTFGVDKEAPGHMPIRRTLSFCHGRWGEARAFKKPYTADLTTSDLAIPNVMDRFIVFSIDCLDARKRRADVQNRGRECHP
jgi:hypothetical protein